MLNNLANTNRNGTGYKQPVEEVSKYNELQEEIDNLTVRIDDNSAAIYSIESDITSLDNRVQAVEDNTTFPEVNTDRINPITGSAVEIPNIDSDNIDAVNITTATLTVNGTDFDDVRQDSATAKANSQTAINTADAAEDKADEAIGKVQQLKEQLQEEVVTEGLSATTAAITNTVSAGQVVTSDLTAVDAEINTLYTSKIVAKDVISPSQDEPYTTITIPKGITVSFKGLNKTLNDVIHEWRITVQDGSVVFKQDVDQIIRDISFDKATGNTKIRINNVYGDIEYISTVVDGTGPITNEAMGTAYTDYVYAPLKVSGIIYKGYADDSTIIEIPAIIHAYAIQADEQRFERETVDIIRINDAIELPEDYGTGVVTTYSTGEENQYISVQKKSGVTKPTWTSPIHSTIGSLSYSSKLVDEATVASYKGISETRQTQTISITNEASLQQLTAFHWTKNGNYWQPYELTRITIGDNTMWIDPTEANQGIRFYNNHVIADGTWDDAPVEEANAVPVNLVIFDAPTELSFPITNLGDKTTVHGEITATCFKGNVLGNVTGNADTATDATCFDNKTYAEAKADILSGKAAQATLADLATNSTCFDGKTYSQACTDILSGNAATATNANNADNFDGKDYATAKADILSGNAASATNATCFNGKTYSEAKTDILSGNAASATNATCFNGKTYAQAKADILSGCVADSNKFNNKDYATACADILKGKACTSCLADCACTVKRAQSSSSSAIPVVLTDAATAVDNGQILVDCDNKLTYTPSTDTLCTGNLEATTDVKAANVCGSTLVKGVALCSTGDLNVDGDAYITGDLTVQGTITTTHSEEVVTPSENIILRDGATTPVASGCYSGFTVTNYDGQNNLEVGADKDGTLHVGVVGGTMEPIATRATEACMEDGYAAHWDSTGTDLVTKGTTNTHDLCINGDATATGTITGTFSGSLTGNVTGNVTGNLTGNADTATDATCFGGKTYAEAKADILSGCAADSNKLAGKTYAETKADILSGHAASAAYATKVVPFCDAADEEKNLAFFNSNVDCGNPDTIQYDAEKNITFNPVSNNLTVAGDVKAKNAVRRGEYYNITSGNTGKYVLLAQASYAYNGNHDLSLTGSITNGNVMLEKFSVAVRSSGNAIENSTFRLLYNPGDSYKATYDFDADSHTITIRLYAKIYYMYQRIKIAIDNFTKGDVYPFASTYDSALTLPMTVSATMTGTEITTTYMKVESSTNADNSTCFNGCTYAQAKSDIRSGLISDIGIDVNCGDTCVCTLNNGSTLALSANAFNENATISTDTYPGACCTGTSNYVVTTMVCCAKQVCRNQATTGTCHLALFDGKTAIANADMYVSNACELTYDPANGRLYTRKVCQCFDSFHTLVGNPSGATRYMEIKLASINTIVSSNFNAHLDFDVYTNRVEMDVIGSGEEGAVVTRASRTSDYAITRYLPGAYDSTDKTITLYVEFKGYRNIQVTSTTPIVSITVLDEAPTGTFVDIPFANRTSYINTSSTNAEYPLVFSTCCATPAAGNRTLYNDSANNLMYNPSTNKLTTCCIRAANSVISGNPAVCTSTQSGNAGTLVDSGVIEVYGSTPYIDFHHNSTCANYSHRLIANNGYLRVTASNATGCCAATQSANFDFCSDGTLAANTVRVGSSNIFYAPKADNSGRPTLHLLRDITCAVCCSACAWSAIGKACITRCPNSGGGYSGSRCIDFQVLMQYGTTGASNANVEMLSQYTNALKPVIVTRNDGCVYFATCSTGAGNLSYDMQGACCVICEVCYNGTAYTDANGTYTIAKEGSLAEITSCVSNATNATNATCFGGCTYAQAKADIAGSVETTEFTCINDVNSGAQDILMTSSTGTLGIVNASTGTNACPLTFNPATGELATSCIKVCNKSLIKGEVGGSAGSNDYPIMTLNSCCFQVYVGTSPDALPDDSSNVLTVKNACINVGFSSRAGSASITLGSFSCACGENSIVIGRASNASSCMIVIGNSLSLCTGDEQSNCINAIVMSPHIDNCWACPSHIFGCARIMFKYGTKQCTMYKFLNCLFRGRDFTNCAYAYASRLVNGDCCGRIVGWDGLSYYAIRRNAAYSFCMDNHWSACHSCEDVIPTCCTNGYASFDLVW
jgi:hypothetical protein